MVQLLREIVRRLLNKWDVEFPCDSAALLLCGCPPSLKTGTHIHTSACSQQHCSEFPKVETSQMPAG